MACAADETKPFWSSPSAKRSSGNLLGLLWALNKDINAASHRLLTGLRFPYKGLMGTCGQPGYVFRYFCLKQGIEFIIFCLN